MASVRVYAGQVYAAAMNNVHLIGVSGIGHGMMNMCRLQQVVFMPFYLISIRVLNRFFFARHIWAWCNWRPWNR